MNKTRMSTSTLRVLAASAIAASIFAAAPVDAAELTAKQTAKASDDARRSKTEHQVMTMTLTNKRGQSRVRTIEGWSKELSDVEEHRFSRFLKPSDIRNTTLLSYDYNDERDDDTWLYLPALKKIKRILSSNKKDYFMGSDFTYEDMENIDIVNWNYSFAEPETFAGEPCWVVEAVPANEKEASETSYSKTVSWIAKSDMLSRKGEYWDKKGRLAKRLLVEDIHPTSDSDPRPRGHRMTMSNLITGHNTVLDMTTLELDVEVKPSLFSQRSLRQ